MTLQTGPDAAALLTTALEKLLYLESRLESAEAAREEARRDGDRLREAASQIRRQLSDWQRRATEAEVAAEGAGREASLLRDALAGARHQLVEAPTLGELASKLRDAEDRLARFGREREAWLDRMVALSRMRTEGEDELDLGSFIAELRSELMALRSGETRAPSTLSSRPVQPEAQRLVDAAPPADLDVDALLSHGRLTRAERTLARLCALDLASDSPALRRRAAERLAESSIDALNPLVVKRLHAEREPQVRVAYVRLIDDTGSAESAAVVLGEALGDADARVRTAALEGLARRRTTEHLDAAFRDPAPAVRRRALALLGRAPDALDRLAGALQDDDASVRRVGAIGLAARTGAEAIALLRVAARSHDPSVRRIACETLERRGLALDPPVEEPAPITEEPAPVLAPEPAPAPPGPLETEPVPSLADGSAPAFESDPDPALDERILEEIRMSLRGRTIGELASLLHGDEVGIGGAIDRLTAGGQLVWRGRKLYPA